jgi:Stealth protein CR2, conserved region 2/Stealth protein CR1, conserved region 1
MNGAAKVLDDGLVDLVYLWVDGSDEAWQAQRSKDFAAWNQAHPNELAVYGNVAGRFRDNGELRFNLRCVDTFLTGVGTIFVITDNQRPSWLADHPQICVLSHNELVDRQRTLGIYDSGNLETYVHRIDGLRERFVYLNDVATD